MYSLILLNEKREPFESLFSEGIFTWGLKCFGGGGGTLRACWEEGPLALYLKEALLQYGSNLKMEMLILKLKDSHFENGETF